MTRGFRDIPRVTKQEETVAFPGDGQFHLYVLTSDATGTRFYIDSSRVFASATQLNITPSGDNTRFGAQFRSFGEFFHGLIDDVLVYDGALTADQVGQLQTPRGGTVCSTLRQ